MNSHEQIKRVSILHFICGCLLIFIVFMDPFLMNVETARFYSPIKAITISTYFLVSLLVWKKKLNPTLGFDLSNITIYVYGFVGMIYWHPAYVFTFFEAMSMICICYVGPVSRYLVTWAFGITLGFLGIQLMPELIILKDAESLKPHLIATIVVFGILTLSAYNLFNHQRTKLDAMTVRFASLGRQSAFLLHEIKAPLARFMAKNKDLDATEADNIYSIVEGVEILMRHPEDINLNVQTFQWSEVREYLLTEFEDLCRSYQIKLEISGLEGEGRGQKSTIRLALRNLVKNGVESSGGIIRIEKINNELTVSTNGSPLDPGDLNEVFRPFYSTKKTSSNRGIGLYFVESVFKAHNARITAHQNNEWTIFRIQMQDAT